ncbi:DUF3107 domain-containing protein [Salininema proteolyticum]|uniref:DUF3107 domain-containing protein n=1 Tax=Salininema proteolyticum TaxID=1607685 RepID=A0ABV8TZT3_9ACTN
MEIKIGVQYAPRELVIDVKEKADDLAATIDKALADGGLLRLADKNGRQVIVPVDKLAYVEVEGREARQVGFAVE